MTTSLYRSAIGAVRVITGLVRCSDCRREVAAADIACMRPRARCKRCHEQRRVALAARATTLPGVRR